MRLSIGVYIELLSLCMNSEETKANLARALVKAVDPEREYSIDDSYVVRLVKCLHDLTKPADVSVMKGLRFADVVPVARGISISELANEFAKTIMSKINFDKRGNLALAFMYIIKHDADVDKNLKSFEEYVGKTKEAFLEQKEIYFPSLLAGMFLYSLLVVDNKAGRGCAIEEECPVAKANTDASKNHDKLHNKKPEYIANIAEAKKACKNVCVLHIDKEYMASFDNEKNTIVFVDGVAKPGKNSVDDSVLTVHGHYVRDNGKIIEMGSGHTFNSTVNIG